MAIDTFNVRFWGARGTLASTSLDTGKYGGNTACIEVTCGDEVLIFDAGSGLRGLGSKLAREARRADKKGEKRKKLNLLFTHCHYDHISGLPFFEPFFDKKTTVKLWSGHLPGPDKTKRMVHEYMRSPFFPVGPEVFTSKLEYQDFEPGDVLKPIRGATVQTMSLNHHDGCVGYRIDFQGRSICFITDTTHIPDKPDAGIIEFTAGADLMIYDATYTDSEFPMFWNFGHSTWEEGARLAKAAGVKRYCMFHHRPSRTDEALDEIRNQCKDVFRRSWAAYEGLVIKV